jgi:hypothetical protein
MNNNRWPVRNIVTSYAAMFVVALIAIWVIDRKVHGLTFPNNLQANTPTAPTTR